MYVSYKVIGSHIRSARKAKKLSQERLAERIGMSPVHFGRLERGERRASLEQLAHIADALHVSTFSLLSGCLVREPLCAAPTAESHSFADALARITADCAPDELELLREICEVFSRQRKNASA